MIKNASINRCLKSDFKAIEQIKDTTYIICWGYKDEVENVYKVNEETGETIFTGEVKETDYCTYASGTYQGTLTKQELDKAFAKFHRLPRMRELKSFGEVLGMADEQIVQWMLFYLLDAVIAYDKSENVEEFYVNGYNVWLDSTMRNKVRENLEACEKEGLTETTLRFNGKEFPITVAAGWYMYYALLAYARDTWNATEIHKSTIPTITTVQGMIDYEDYYPTAYPKKLSF